MTDIIFQIDSVIRLKIDSLEPDLFNLICSELTYNNPAYFRMQAMIDKNPEKFKYAKIPPQEIKNYLVSGNTLSIPRGRYKWLIDLFNRYNLKYTKIDKRVKFETNQIDLKPGVELFWYQKYGMGKLILGRQGVVVAPCGAGKTVLGVATICKIGQPTLILVHEKVLISQWKSEIENKTNYLEKYDEVGIVGSGIKNVKYITIALIQTLMRYTNEEKTSFLKQFGNIVIDECHHVPASSFLGIINHAPCMYRHGLTATPERADSLQMLLYDTVGEILQDITDDDLEQSGRSQTASVSIVHTGFQTLYTADEWTSLISELVNDKDRNNLIIEKVVEDWEAGHFPLVLSDRVSHCQLLKRELEKRGLNCCLLIGKVSRKMRDDVISASKKGLMDCVIGTKVADEGLDIPNLSNIHLTTPSKNKSKIKQRIGRIRRPIKGKYSLVRDYVDVLVPNLLKKSVSRKGFYKSWGFKIYRHGENPNQNNN